MGTAIRRKTGEKGQTLLMATLGIPFILGILGLVVDVGYGYYVKQCAQSAADSAAMAASIAANATSGVCGTTVLCQTNYTCPASPTNATNFGIACQYAQTNNFLGSNQTVTVSSGTGTPPSAPGLTTAYWVTVTASQKQFLGFLSALSATGGYITAQSTSAVVSSGGGSGCVYVMNPTQNQSFTVSGNNSFVNSNCGIYVNSKSTNALSVQGGATITASVVNVVGGVQLGGPSTVTPTPNTGVTAAADPLASLPAPTYSGCNHTSLSISGGTTTLNPGVYCNGITVSGTSIVTFNPGTYILNGGGFNISSTNVYLTGSGVFFYNTANGYAYKPVVLSGGTNVTLTAPTSGTYQGILFFDDRTITSSAQNTISGNTGAVFSGSIYMLKQQLVFSGGSTSGALTLAIVCDEFTVTGGAYLKKDTTGTLTGMGTVASYLVQ